MALVKDVWQGRDNHFGLILESTDEDGVRAPADLSLVTQVMLELKGSDPLVVLRDAVDAPIDWWSAGLSLGEGEMRFTLGDYVESIDPGSYVSRLTVYSLSTPDGVVWTSFARNELLVSVHAT